MQPEPVKTRLASLREFEERLHRLESQLLFQASLLDHVYNAVIATDIHGTITQWNRSAEKLYQWRAGEVLGKKISDVIIPDSERQKAREMMTVLASSAGHWEGEFLVKRKDGFAFSVWLADSVIRGEKGEIAGYVGVSTDITERKLLEEQLRQAHKYESLGIMAGGMAHDFNNLLVGILGNSSILQEMVNEDDPMRPMLDDIVEASARAADLVQQMLAYAGKGRYFLESLDLSAQVWKIGADLRGVVPASVEIRLEVEENPPPIRADPTQIRQIVTNLLLNAVEAIGPSPGKVTIRTESRPNGYMLLEISDTGCGMDQATQARIFDPFFSTKFPGRGLGLAAVQGIVKAHKGTLTVRSTEGEGSVFRLLLPIAR